MESFLKIGFEERRRIITRGREESRRSNQSPSQEEKDGEVT